MYCVSAMLRNRKLYGTNKQAKCHFAHFHSVHEVGRHGGAVVGTGALQQEGSVFESAGQPEPFCVECARSPRACKGSQVLRFPQAEDM